MFTKTFICIATIFFTMLSVRVDGQPLIEVARKMKAIEGMQPQINDMERRMGIMQSIELTLALSIHELCKIVGSTDQKKSEVFEWSDLGGQLKQNNRYNPCGGDECCEAELELRAIQNSPFEKDKEKQKTIKHFQHVMELSVKDLAEAAGNDGFCVEGNWCKTFEHDLSHPSEYGYRPSRRLKHSHRSKKLHSNPKSTLEDSTKAKYVLTDAGTTKYVLTDAGTKMDAIHDMRKNVAKIEQQVARMSVLEPTLENIIKTLQKVVDVRGMGRRRLIQTPGPLANVRKHLHTLKVSSDSVRPDVSDYNKFSDECKRAKGQHITQKLRSTHKNLGDPEHSDHGSELPYNCVLIEVYNKMKAIEGKQPQINDLERRLGILQSVEPVLENAFKTLQKVVDERGMRR